VSAPTNYDIPVGPGERGGAGKYIPPGAFLQETSEPGPVIFGVQAPFEVLKRLAGALEWRFVCLQDSTSVAAGNAIGNVTAGVPTNFLVQPGFEGLIDWLVVGPNMNPSTTQATWNAALTGNAVPFPGYEFFGRLKASDGAGNWWVESSIFVPENTLIELRKASDGFGVAPNAIGGDVHGWVWPIRARIEWEAQELARLRVQSGGAR
jgi:hypothetical protein